MLWQELVKHVNSLWRQFAAQRLDSETERELRDLPFKYAFVLDDDKVHCAQKSGEYTYGIKLCVFGGTRQVGFNIHTLVSSSSNLVYGIRPEGVREQTADCLIALCKHLTSHSPDGPPNMPHILLLADRGYTNFDALSAIIQSGGLFLGTLTRRLRWPYTFGNPRFCDDAQTKVPRQGAAVYLESVAQNDHAFRVSFFRRGGSVVIMGTNVATFPALTTVQDCTDDSNLHKPVRYLDPTTNHFEKDILEHLPVQWAVATQGTAFWFILRRFSVTSTTSSVLIQLAAKSDHAECVEWQKRPNWKRVNEILGIRASSSYVDIDESDSDGDDEADVADDVVVGSTGHVVDDVGGDAGSEASGVGERDGVDDVAENTRRGVTDDGDADAGDANVAAIAAIAVADANADANGGDDDNDDDDADDVVPAVDDEAQMEAAASDSDDDSADGGSNAGPGAESVDVLKGQLTDPSFVEELCNDGVLEAKTKGYLNRLVLAMGQQPVRHLRTAAKCMDDARLWLHSAPSIRPFLFCSKAQLTSLLVLRKQRVRRGMTRAQMLNVLSGEDDSSAPVQARKPTSARAKATSANVPTAARPLTAPWYAATMRAHQPPTFFHQPKEK